MLPVPLILNGRTRNYHRARLPDVVVLPLEGPPAAGQQCLCSCRVLHPDIANVLLTEKIVVGDTAEDKLRRHAFQAAVVARPHGVIVDLSGYANRFQRAWRRC